MNEENQEQKKSRVSETAKTVAKDASKSVAKGTFKGVVKIFRKLPIQVRVAIIGACVGLLVFFLSAGFIMQILDSAAKGIANGISSAINYLNNSSGSEEDSTSSNDVSQFVEIVGNKNEGYALKFKDGTDEALTKMFEENRQMYVTSGIYNISTFKEFIKAELATEFPDLGKQVSQNDPNEFQGGVQLRRLTPNKKIGEFRDGPINDKSESTSDVTQTGEGYGRKEDIPENIKKIMESNSEAKNSNIDYSNLSYLTIPYLDFQENIKDGHIIVNKELANEVIEIFYELYKIKYPIENMFIVDEYSGEASKYADAGSSDTIQMISMKKNNTYSFCYSSILEESELAHATGNAIDLNPRINPIVKSGVATLEDSKRYVDRDWKTLKENDPEKDAALSKDAEAVKIFTDRGWIWKGTDDPSNTNYMHFEKNQVITEQSVESLSLDSNVYDLRYVTQDEFQNYIDNNDEEALKVFTLDDNKKAIIATWSYSSDSSPQITISKGKTLNYKKALSKYTMPYEYLGIMMGHARDSNFGEKLAKLAMNSEYIVMIEDNVTTTKTVVQTSVTTEGYEFDEEGIINKNYTRYSGDTKTTIKESVSQKAEVTYVDCWYIKFWKDISFSSESLAGAKNQKVDSNTKINGTFSYSSTSNSSTTSQTTGGNETGGYEVITTTITTTTGKNSYEYDTGVSHIEGNAQEFVELYKNSEYRIKGNIYIPWLTESLKGSSKTINLIDVTKYLFYQANSKNYKSTTLKFADYEPGDFEDVKASGGQISLTTPILSKEDFIKALEEYNAEHYGGSNGFLNQAETIWDSSIATGVNPELVVVTAKAEQNFSPGGGANNYWGIGVFNGSNSGGSYGSLAEGIAAYADVIASYNPGGKFAAQIQQIYEERKESGCSPLGYGQPGTFSGMQSIYSNLGKHGEAYSGPGAGGYYYMDPAIAGVTTIYATHEEFMEKCYNAGGEHAAGTNTTVWEQGQYTAWQVQKKIDIWNDIFGKYGSLGASGGDFLAVAKQVWEKVCQQNPVYGGSMIPADGTGSIDCSGYVSWVIYEYGYTEFEGWQHNTVSLIDTNWTDKYGWEEINIQAGENVINQLQPGDILVRGVGSGNSGHTLIVVEVSNGRLMAYDCGGQSNWEGNTNADPVDQTYFTNYGWPGKIIRVTPPSS